MVFCSYPITPASALLHHLAKLRGHGVTTFQAEDEIAAACAAIGASYAGSLGVTASSGPGIALKTEAIGLAVATELPLVIVNAQRGGPSTGLPTKTEQSDLYQAVMGRNGDTPIVGARRRHALRLLRHGARGGAHRRPPHDAGHAADRRLPRQLVRALADPRTSTPRPAFPVRFRTEPEGFHPYLRDERLVRPWVKPGTPGLEHRIGGIEKDHDSGNISYDPANHQRMTDARWDKVLKVADDMPEQAASRAPPVRSRPSSAGAAPTGRSRAPSCDAREPGLDVAHVHLRHIWPLPRNLGELLRCFDRDPGARDEQGQLVTCCAASTWSRPEGLSKVTGQPFTIAELDAAIDAALEAEPMNAPSSTCASPRTTPPTRKCAGARAAATTPS